MTGPPTPPPSSATEIEDAARTTLPPPQAVPATEPEPAAAAPAPAEPAPAPVQATPVVQASTKTAYELLFPSIAELARSGSVNDLIQVAERGDLSAESDKDPARIYVVAPLVLAYLITDQIQPATHVLRRLPQAFASFPLIQHLFNLTASVFDRKYINVYMRAESLHQMVTQPHFEDPVLGQILAGMTVAFVDAFRKRTFNLLSRAYTSIPIKLAEAYLGLSAESVLNAAILAGWTFDQASQILTPKPAPKLDGSGAAQSTLMALNLVAETVANLET